MFNGRKGEPPGECLGEVEGSKDGWAVCSFKLCHSRAASRQYMPGCRSWCTAVHGAQPGLAPDAPRVQQAFLYKKPCIHNWCVSTAQHGDTRCWLATHQRALHRALNQVTVGLMSVPTTPQAGMITSLMTSRPTPQPATHLSQPTHHLGTHSTSYHSRSTTRGKTVQTSLCLVNCTKAAPH